MMKRSGSCINLHAAVLMVAEKGADLILQEA
jgi:hypothetical protein